MTAASVGEGQPTTERCADCGDKIAQDRDGDWFAPGPDFFCPISTSRSHSPRRHVSYTEQAFLAKTWDAGCSCGWEACDFETIDEADAACVEHWRSSDG